MYRKYAVFQTVSLLLIICVLLGNIAEAIDEDNLIDVACECYEIQLLHLNKNVDHRDVYCYSLFG